MSGTFSMEAICIPTDKEAKARKLLEQFDLTDELEVENVLARFKVSDKNDPAVFLQQKEGETTYTSINSIKENLFPEIAKLLKDTPIDGQLISFSVDDEDEGEYLFLQGNVRWFNFHPKILTGYNGVPAGMEVKDKIIVKVLGLGNGRVAIIEYPK